MKFKSTRGNDSQPGEDYAQLSIKVERLGASWAATLTAESGRNQGFLDAHKIEHIETRGASISEALETLINTTDGEWAELVGLPPVMERALCADILCLADDHRNS